MRPCGPFEPDPFCDSVRAQAGKGVPRARHQHADIPAQQGLGSQDQVCHLQHLLPQSQFVGEFNKDIIQSIHVSLLQRLQNSLGM